MAIGMYLCNVIGNGTRGDPIRSAASRLGVKQWSVFHFATPDGHKPWTLSFVEGADLSSFDKDVRCYAMPEISFDTLYATLSQPVKDKIEAGLGWIGVDKTFITATTTYGDVILHVARQLDSTMTRERTGR